MSCNWNVFSLTCLEGHIMPTTMPARRNTIAFLTSENARLSNELALCKQARDELARTCAEWAAQAKIDAGKISLLKHELRQLRERMGMPAEQGISPRRAAMIAAREYGLKHRVLARVGEENQIQVYDSEARSWNDVETTD